MSYLFFSGGLGGGEDFIAQATGALLHLLALSPLLLSIITHITGKIASTVLCCCDLFYCLLSYRYLYHVVSVSCSIFPPIACTTTSKLVRSCLIVGERPLFFKPMLHSKASRSRTEQLNGFALTGDSLFYQ